MIPGINDSHMHLLNVGMDFATAPITGVSSVDEMVERVKEFVRQESGNGKAGGSQERAGTRACLSRGKEDAEAVMIWIGSPQRCQWCSSGSAAMWQRPTVRPLSFWGCNRRCAMWTEAPLRQMKTECPRGSSLKCHGAGQWSDPQIYP